MEAKAAPEQAPARPSGKLRELDALRGIGVLAVVVYHALFWSDRPLITGVPGTILHIAGGWAGVDLFFVLSGYLITGMLLDARPRPRFFRTFYIRRMLRIWPAYFGLLGLLALSAHITLPFAVASTFFAANLCGLFGIPMPYGPLWSLAVEEQFYLAWPVVVRVASATGLAAIAVVVLLTEPGLRYLTFLHHDIGGLYRYTWLRLDGLALGALVCLFVRSRWMTLPRLGRLGWVLAALAGLAAVLGARHGIMTRRLPLGAAFQLSVIALASAAVVCLVMRLGQSRFRWLVQVPALEFFGEISYGLYLYHMLVFLWYDRLLGPYAQTLVGHLGTVGLTLIRFTLAASSAVVLATLSRRYYEQLFLRLRSRLAPIQPVAAPVAATADHPFVSVAHATP